MQNYIENIPSIKKRNSPTGFTLLEIIISLTIFVIGVLAVFYLFPIGLKASKKSQSISKVSILAQRVLDEVKVAGFQAMDPANPQFPLEGTEDNLRWKLSIRDKQAPATEKNSLREVNLTIFWTEEGRENWRSFLTYLMDY